MNTDEKKIYQIILLIFLLLSVPVLLLSFYNVPSADDYTFGRAVQLWIKENGYHLPGMIKCAIQNSVHYYFNWQGRYSESFFASFMPDIFGSYWVWAIFIYCFFSTVVVLLFRILAKSLAGEEGKKTGVCIGVLVTIATIQNIPYPVEAFFWFDGSMAYLFHHTLYLWMMILIVSYCIASDKKKGGKYLAGASLLAILVAGGNNVTAFASVLTLGTCLAVAIWKRKKQKIVIPFLCSATGFMVSYLSPGTRIRGGDMHTPVLLTIRKCFVWTIKQYFLKWTFPVMLILLLFLTPFLFRIIQEVLKKTDFQFPYPLLMAIGVVCAVSSMSSPSFYILGEPGPGRLKNVIYINYVIAMVLLYGYVMGWFIRKYPKTKIEKNIYSICNKCCWQMKVAIVVAGIGLLCVGGFDRSGVSIEAVSELVSGEAAKYHTEETIRKEIYLNNQIVNAEVEPYSVKPELLFFDDITDDSDNWKNKGLAEFYGKNSVKLSRYDEDVDYD